MRVERAVEEGALRGRRRKRRRRVHAEQSAQNACTMMRLEGTANSPSLSLPISLSLTYPFPFFIFLFLKKKEFKYNFERRKNKMGRKEWVDVVGIIQILAFYWCLITVKYRDWPWKEREEAELRDKECCCLVLQGGEGRGAWAPEEQRKMRHHRLFRVLINK